MAPSAIEKLEMDREILQATLANLERKIISHRERNFTQSMVEVQFEKVKSLRANLHEIHTKITYQNPEDLEIHTTDYIDLLERLDECHTSLLDIQVAITPTTNNNNAPNPTPSSSHVTLPRMDLPTFTGNYEDWPSFSDLFTAMIDNNLALTNAQKLQFLKSCVKDEASNLIKSFTITDSNYTEAWGILNGRFDNKREIQFSLIKKLVFQQTLRNESAQSLQALLNTSLECVRSLKVLGQPTGSWDSLLVVLITEKLDKDTKSEWAKTLTSTEVPSFKDLTDFLEKHIRGLQARGVVAPLQGSSGYNKYQNQNAPVRRSAHFAAFTPYQVNCALCNGSHQLYQCTKLHNMSPEQRQVAVRRTPACFNCLRGGHSANSCTSKNLCRICSMNHHTLLHVVEESNIQSNNIGASKASTTATTSQIVRSNIAAKFEENNQVLLKTAVAMINDGMGFQRKCRILIDDGSEASFITSKCAKALGLTHYKTDVLVEGVSSSNSIHVTQRVIARFFSIHSDEHIDVEALVLPNVTGKLPKQPCHEAMSWTHLHGMPLADPNFSSPANVDMLLGADVMATIIRHGIKTMGNNYPYAQNTIFGWTVSGQVNGKTKQNTITVSSHICRLDELIQRFWKQEDVLPKKSFTPEERACVKHFDETHRRKADGRYVVRLPFNSKKSEIGETRTTAVQRLLQLEKRFERNPQHKEEYKEFLREYLHLGHMELAERPPSYNPVYIPHHFVTKEDSSTTKLRVVFDGSMKLKSGISLNAALMVGPTIQQDLWTLLLRFRTFPIALKADITKMYRQFEVHEDDRDYQRILWRDDPTEEIREYRLTTVSYGTSSAPFLATKCLAQLAEDEKDKFPAAATALNNNTYVDDHIGGEQTEDAAILLRKEIQELCKAGGLEIRKWCSNSKKVIDSIPEHLQDAGASWDLDDDNKVKALGVRWKPDDDIFHFEVNQTRAICWTKRLISSEIAKTFDPVGWLTPVTITAKILLQDLWRHKIEWDDKVPDYLARKWIQYQNQLQSISDIRIPRCIIPNNTENFQIHGFSDASEKAYSACVYLRCYHNGSVTTHLITSKSKVAPLEQKSLPRLELCGALLLAELMSSIVEALNLNAKLFAWTDSMIVLQWLTSSSRRWKTYVANRVAAIQELIPPECWNHVHGGNNPADLPSRGISPFELVNSYLRWKGPSWLTSDQFPMSTPVVDMNDVISEERTTTITSMVCVSQTESLLDKLCKFSCFDKIITAVGWLTRFSNHKKKAQISTGPLSAAERALAVNRIVHFLQQESFPGEIISLKQNKNLASSSQIKNLNPFLDDGETIRVGGRLTFANIPADMKHPMVIPANHHITTLLIQKYHNNNLHSGFTLTLSLLRRKFWIVRGRAAVRNTIGKCITCRKAKATQLEQQMGNLPGPRVQPSRPFLHAGVDFAGPFMIKMRSGRGARAEKCYICVFVCFSTKACHLEVVTGLSTSAFIACYRRFIARRGVSSHLYSDCGTNFIGADKELKKMFEDHQKLIQHHLSLRGTNWVFNPPSAPHQGGLWEAAVKSTKYHLKRSMGTILYTLEEFQTLLCNVEACLNSRPLCPISSDMSDLNAPTIITGHFIIGEPLCTIPESDLTHINPARLDHWQHIQQTTQNFWKRWQNEYHSTLQPRQKWTKISDNVKIGDLVIIRDETMPPTRWKLGRIVKTHEGADKLVRKVTLKTSSGELLRPITKINISVIYLLAWWSLKAEAGTKNPIMTLKGGSRGLKSPQCVPRIINLQD